MSALQSLIDKLRQLLGKHSDKAERGVDRVTRLADDKTGGKYSEKIQQGAEKAKGYIPGQDGGASEAAGSAGSSGAADSTGSTEQAGGNGVPSSGDSQVPGPRENRS